MDMKELEYLSQALEKASTLKSLLEDEFEALKALELTAFETLQPEKIEILSFLASDDLADRVKAFSANNANSSAYIAIWDDVISIVAQCRDLHRRNEIFMLRKLESIRGALQTIQSPDPLNSVEVYDRLGKVRPNRNRKNMGQA
jgi:flagellar biosynthesis/type III secretory pathway chaperone|tara:strand:- start:16395 stop:16826 length:432 start_codon:yes stop_codon:yes gene_type:complete